MISCDTYHAGDGRLVPQAPASLCGKRDGRRYYHIWAAVLRNNNRTPAVTVMTANETGNRERGLTLTHGVYRGGCYRPCETERGRGTWLVNAANACSGIRVHARNREGRRNARQGCVKYFYSRLWLGRTTVVSFTENLCV